MPAPRKTPEERKTILKALEAKQRAADRRRAWLIYGTGGFLVAAIIAFGGVRRCRQSQAA